jgi:hypothetical protein
MSYTSRILHRLLGTDEIVYSGNVLGRDDAEYKLPMQDLSASLGGPESPVSVSMYQPVVIDAWKYTIIFNAGQKDECKVEAYVDAKSRRPNFIGTKMIVTTKWFLGMRDRDYNIVSYDGERVPVLRLDIID